MGWRENSRGSASVRRHVGDQHTPRTHDRSGSIPARAFSFARFFSGSTRRAGDHAGGWREEPEFMLRDKITPTPPVHRSMPRRTRWARASAHHISRRSILPRPPTKSARRSTRARNNPSVRDCARDASRRALVPPARRRDKIVAGPTPIITKECRPPRVRPQALTRRPSPLASDMRWTLHIPARRTR